jgi:hypothetical protein
MSDKVAELALTCCKVLLERCPVQSGERALELLQRIGAVAALNRKAAAEEVGSLLVMMPACLAVHLHNT